MILGLLVELTAFDHLMVMLLTSRSLHHHHLLPDGLFSQTALRRLIVLASLRSEKGVLDLEGAL